MSFEPPTCSNCGEALPWGSHSGDPCPACGRPDPGAEPDEPRVAVELVGTLKPTLEVTDFDWTILPRINPAGELVGATMELSHPTWPLNLRLLVERLELVSFATGILALVESHESERG